MVALAPTIRGPIADRLYLPLKEKRWEDIPDELCFWGPAGTGKSFSLLLVLALLMRDPEIGGLRILWTRKTRKSISESSIPTYAKVLRALGEEMSSTPSPSMRQREVVHTPAGENVLVWMDLADPGKAFSAEYDIVVYEEAYQISEATYELAGARCLRNYAIPRQFMVSLTNPAAKQHWLYRRMFVTKKLTEYQVLLQDNPAYFDLEAGELLEPGAQYLRGMKHRLSGSNYQRLVVGEWCSEEGWVLEGALDEARHFFRGEWHRGQFGKPCILLSEGHPCLPEKIELEWTFGSMDLGFVNAATLQAWGVDAAGRMYLLEEVYHSGKDRDWWADRIIEFSRKYRLDSIVADHDPERHAHWNSTLAERLPDVASWDGDPFVRKCEKTRGDKDALKVDVVRTLLHDGPDGMPRCFLNTASLQHKPDPELEATAKPTSLHEELPQLVWKEQDPDKVDDKLPEEKLHPGRANHAFDAWVYAGRYLRDREDKVDWPEAPRWETGSFEHHLEHLEGRKVKNRWTA